MSEADRAAEILHKIDTAEMTAPELYSVLTATKPLADQWPLLLRRIADQIDRRAAAGGLVHDQGGDPSETATHAATALRAAALHIRESVLALDDAHNSLSHLGDAPSVDHR